MNKAIKKFEMKIIKVTWPLSDGTLIWPYAWNCGVGRRGGQHICDVSIGIKI